MDTHTSPSDVDARNRETERKEIAWLQSAPDRVFLYVGLSKWYYGLPYAQRFVTSGLGSRVKSCCRLAHSMHAIKCPVCQLSQSEIASASERDATIGTWLGTPIATHVRIGRSVKFPGFGCGSVRRSVDCRIYGVRYVGWYFESAGDYCRLRKSKRQPTTKA